MRKLVKGFTLVELVVVIAIIGVLAAILVPNMLNYIRKARLKSANTNAKSAYNAVAAFIASKEVDGVDKATAIGYYGNSVIDCTTSPNGAGNIADAQEEVCNILIENGVEAGKVWVDSETINDEDTFYVQWSGDKDPTTAGAVFGQYPDAVTWEKWKSGSPQWCSYCAP